MYNFTDSNQELTTIEPEYTAMFCEEKQEVTFFYSNDIEDYSTAKTLEEADQKFEAWADTKRG